MINRKTFLALLSGLGLSVLIHGCSQSGSSLTESANASASATGDGLTGKLVITGSSTVAPLVGELGKVFESQHPAVRIDVQTGGSSRGIADARQGLADIGMVSRGLKADEADLYGFEIARDGISIILHQDNPVAELSIDQIKAIYTGDLTNWQEVGGVDQPITVVNKADGRSTLELFLSFLKLDATAIQAQVIIGDNEQGIKTVAGNPNAIGYVSIGAAEFSIDSGESIQLLPIEGVPASTETVQDGRFPLSRVLTVVTAQPPEGLSQQFIEFIQSDAVTDTVKSQNFVPLTPTVAP